MQHDRLTLFKQLIKVALFERYVGGKSCCDSQAENQKYAL
jgi:hypothetical protein